MSSVPDVLSPYEIVTQQFGVATGYAATTFNLAIGYLGTLSDILNSISLPDLQGRYTPAGYTTQIERPARPAYQELGAPPDLNNILDRIQALGNIDLPGVDPYNAPAAPTNKAVRPTLQSPGLPNVNIKQFTGTAPAIPDIEMPDEDYPALPDEPELIDIQALLPDPVVLDLPEVDQLPPTFNVEPPNNTFVWTEAPYASDNLTLIVEKSLDMLAGNTVNHCVREQIFSRGREEIHAVSRADKRKAFLRLQARGSFLDDGQLQYELADAEQREQDEKSKLARDLTIDEWTKFVENFKFGLEQLYRTEEKLIDYSDRMQQRAFDAAKYSFQATIEIFNARIAVFREEVNAYNSYISYIRLKLDAELAKLQEYRERLQALELLGQLNEQQITIYRTRVSAIAEIVNMFRAKVDAARGKIELALAKVTAFRETVNAYVAELQAETTKVNLYTAQWQGEKIKADVYATDVAAFATETDAYRSRVSAEAESRRLQIEQGRLLIDRLRAMLDAVQAEVAAWSGMYGAIAEHNRSLALIYQSDTELNRAEAGLAVEINRLLNTDSLNQANFELKKSELNVQRTMNGLTLAYNIVNALAQISSQLAASSMSAVNTSAQIQGSRSINDNTNRNYNFQV